MKKILFTGTFFVALVIAVMGITGCGTRKERIAEPETPEVAISDEARKHFDRGMAAVEIALDSNDYVDAIAEFKNALELAPEWRSAKYNLAIVQDKAGEYDNAMENLKALKETATLEEEIAEIQSLINKVEYKIEKGKEENNYDSVVTAMAAIEVPQEPTEPITIPAINGWVDSLKFYAGGSRDNREYTKYFPQGSTAYVYGELNLEHPDAPWYREDFSFDVVYIKPNGDVLGKFTVDTYVEDGWNSSYHSFSWGWSTPGYWTTGWHQVEIYYKGTLIASEQFSVY